MNNIYTRSGGVWANNTDVLAAELADLDAKTVRSVSGTGGAYYLDDDMVWTGDANAVFDVGVEVIFRQEAQFEDDTSFTGPAYFYGGTSSYGNTFYFGEVTFEDNLTANNDVFLNSDVYVYGQMGFHNHAYFGPGSDPDFEAPVSFHSPVECNSSVVLNGGPLISNVVTILGDATHIVQLRGPTQILSTLTTSGSGSIAHRVLAGDNVATTYSPLAVHEVIVDAGVLSGSTDWFINDTGCVDGNEILFGNKDAAIALDIRRPGGLSLATLTNDWARFVRRSGLWELAQKGSY